ncbi:arylsulfotransferase family protein [Halorussus litoreus]|uniref:arylsulfotransferase family protein n=1 Tax=Halorussus litoreus TaxID=1710536 RepID=UPI000E26587A|nr:aryl-sulfate sulfotransferase [Halorussus litoreus]
MRASARRRLTAALTLVCCLSMVASAAAAPAYAGSAVSSGGVSPLDAGVAQQPNPCVGTVTEPADGLTVISVQGFQFGEDGGKRPAKLVGVGPSGEIRWVEQMAEKYDVSWGYDVDPLPNGNVFVTATTSDHQTLVYEFDPRAQERVWSETFDLADTHDADLINGGREILIANMRNYDESSGANDDSLRVYNRTTGEFEWVWRFDDHYDPDDMEENYTDDWSHVNDIDKIGDGRYLASPRNFDQAIVVNRSTGEIEMKLGEDGRHGILDEQHNPDYLESENGTPTLLVGDSGNDRIVEYANPDGDLTDGAGWNRTWTLAGDLDWPRDADRLPDGDTLVTDSSNHRVVEVSPEGEVVWEFYAPWLVYDAARVSVPGEHATGPTMADLNATGTYEIEGSATLHEDTAALTDCHQQLENVSGWADGQQPTTTANDASTDTAGGEADGTDTTTWQSALDDATTEGDGSGTGGETGTDNPAGLPGFGALAALGGLVAALGVVLRRR